MKIRFSKKAQIVHPQIDLEDYFCTFVGDPRVSTPYALFASEGQAKIFQQMVGPKYIDRIILLKDWRTLDRSGPLPQTFDDLNK